MPIVKDNEYAEMVYGSDNKSFERGNLIVKFVVKFPRFLPERSKEVLRDILD